MAEEHGLQLHDVRLLNMGAVLKTSSGKIQRLACAAAYLKGELKAINSESKPRVRTPVAPPNPRPQDAAEVEMWLRNKIAAKTKTEPSLIDRQAPFVQFGLDSCASTGIRAGDRQDLFDRLCVHARINWTVVVSRRLVLEGLQLIQP